MGRRRRTAPCTRAEAESRLRQAEAFAMVAELVLDDESEAASPSVAAALAVLAGIAASDAACCVKLGERARGQAHAEAVAVLRTVVPHGQDMAKDLARLLASKDEAHYGPNLVDAGKARRLVGYARRMTDLARQVLES